MLKYRIIKWDEENTSDQVSTIEVDGALVILMNYCLEVYCKRWICRVLSINKPIGMPIQNQRKSLFES